MAMIRLGNNTLLIRRDDLLLETPGAHLDSGTPLQYGYLRLHDIADIPEPFEYTSTISRPNKYIDVDPADLVKAVFDFFIQLEKNKISDSVQRSTSISEDYGLTAIKDKPCEITDELADLRTLADAHDICMKILRGGK